jgi:hypothetical protein
VTEAEYQRKRRAAAPAGMCTACTVRPRLEGQKACTVCSAQQVAYRAERVAESRCRYGACGVPPAPGKRSCSAHLTMAAARSQASRLRRRLFKGLASAAALAIHKMREAPKASPAALALAEMRKGKR